jgi:hypothetical protein
MTMVRRIAVVAMLHGLSAPFLGCAPRGSSFETLGIPAPEGRAGRSAVILGWEEEQRAGWVVQRVRVDGRARDEWSAESQQPVVLYLAPGEHRLEINAAQMADGGGQDARPRRRYRVRPMQLDLLEGEAQLCVLALGGDERRRPQLACEDYRSDGGEAEVEDEVDEYGDDYAEDEDLPDEAPAEPRAAAPPPAAAAAPAAPPPAAAAAPAAPPPAAPAATAPASIPSPFGAAAAAAPPPVAVRPAAVPAPPAATDPVAGALPLRLTAEQRIERLERLVEELRRELRAR